MITFARISSLPQLFQHGTQTAGVAANHASELFQHYLASNTSEGGGENYIPSITNKFPNEAVHSEGKIVGEVQVIDGQARRFTNGNPINTGEFNFVITKDNRLVLGRKHTTLSEGEDVLAAGNIVIKGGKVRRIDNLSGHFRPTVEEASRIPDLLQNVGLNTSGAKLELYNIEINSQGYVNSYEKVVNKYLP